MQCNDYTKKRLRTQPVAAHRPRFLEGERLRATRRRGEKVSKVTKFVTLWPKPRQQHEKRGPERQQHSSSDHHDDEEGRGMQEEDASTYEGGRAHYLFNFFCTQITRIKTKTQSHTHHHIAHLHLPFGAGTCRFPQQNWTQCSWPCEHSSTEPSRPVAVSLFHSVLRSRSNMLNEFVGGIVCFFSLEKVTSRQIASGVSWIPTAALLLFWGGICVRGCCPFRLGSGCPRWRLACTWHATCAVAAARSRSAASAPPRQHQGQPLPASTSSVVSAAADVTWRGGGGRRVLRASRDGRSASRYLWRRAAAWYLSADGRRQGGMNDPDH